MIVSKDLEICLPLSNSFTDTDNLDGIAGKISADGKSIEPVASATDMPDGIISQPQGRGEFGQRATATLVLWGAPYKVRLNLGDKPAGVTVKTVLAMQADGTFAKAVGTAGEITVGYALEPVVSAVRGQRVTSKLYADPKVHS